MTSKSSEMWMRSAPESAAKINELLTTAEHLAGSPALRDALQEVNDSVDEQIVTIKARL